VIVTASPTAGVAGAAGDSIADNNLPLVQYFDDAGCNQPNSPQFYGKWGCNKVEFLGGSMFIKKCEDEKFIYDWHWRWIPDYHCLSSTFQVSAVVKTRKCYRVPNSNVYWKVCCGSCGLTGMEIAIIVCSSIIGVLLIITILVCYKWKKCCCQMKNEVGCKDKSNVNVSDVKVTVETEAQEVEGKEMKGHQNSK